MAERLEWEMEAAPILEQLRLRAREPLPFEREVLDRRPEDDEVVEMASRAFDDLGTCRPVGLSVGQIPITAIWQWCDREGLDADATRILSRAIRRTDLLYLRLLAKVKT